LVLKSSGRWIWGANTVASTALAMMPPKDLRSRNAYAGIVHNCSE
jgi:hypothetical protein